MYVVVGRVLDLDIKAVWALLQSKFHILKDDLIILKTVDYIIYKKVRLRASMVCTKK